MEYPVHVEQSCSNDLESKKAETKGEKMVEVRVGRGVAVHGSLWGWMGARYTGGTRRGQPGQRLASDTHIWECLRLVLGWPLWKALVVFCLWGCTMKCRHLDDLFSSCNLGMSTGGRASSCFNTCLTSQGAQCRGRPGGSSIPRRVSTSSHNATSSNHSSFLSRTALD